MLLFFCLFLIFDVSAYEVNYRWYKYENSEYMKLDAAFAIKDSYIDYSDYIYERDKDDEFYTVNKMKGNKIYITNWGSRPIEFTNVKLFYKGEEIKYVWNKTYKRFPHNLVGYSTFSLEYDGLYDVSNIEVVLECGYGDIEIFFSETYSYLKDTIGNLKVKGPGAYKLNNVAPIKYEIPKLYKTYYGKVLGEYNSTSYDDFLYKDLSDYTIKYYNFKNVITSYNETIEDLLDTNYNLVSYENNINYNENGKYNVKLVFEDFTKEEEVYVNILDNEKNIYDIRILELNKKIEVLKDEYENKIDELSAQIKELENNSSKLEASFKLLDDKNKTLLVQTQNLMEEINVLVTEKQKILAENENLSFKLENILDENKTLEKQNQNLTSEVKVIQDELSSIKELNSTLTENYNICYKNKENYLKLVTLKNNCFEELSILTKNINKLNREYYLIKLNYDNDIDYYERYINKLKNIIEEKDVDYWNTKKCSSFVGFKILR